MTNYLRRAITGSSTVFTLSLIAVLIGFLLRIFLAKNLSIEMYGLFYAVLALISFFSIFKSLGLIPALIKYIPEFIVNKQKQSIKNSIWSVLIIQFISFSIITSIIIFYSDFLANSYFHNYAAKSLVIILTLSFLISTLDSIIIVTFQSFQKIFLFALFPLIKSILFLILTFIFVKLGYGAFGAGMGFFCSSLITSMLFLPKFLKITFYKINLAKLTFDAQIIKKLVLFGFPLLLSTTGYLILNYTDTLLLTHFKTLTEVGLYNVALPAASLILYLGTSISSIVFPLTSELCAKKNKRTLITGIQLLHRFLLIVIVPVALIIFSFSDLVLSLLFGEKYILAQNILKILVIGTACFTITHVNFSMVSGIGKPKIIAKIVLGVALLNIILNIILIPLIGVVGAAISTSISQIIMLILSILALKQLINIKLPIISWIKTGLCGIIFLSVITLLRKKIVLTFWKELIIILLITIPIYVITLFLLKIITLKEINEIIKKIIN
ncbi:flippase [Candidatus Woesearchaeota archaeon]|jgi:O-antigen/teichoic acid export membrane protein|nr:flippase [Candidatus Woesearchaeota archaeon]